MSQALQMGQEPQGMGARPLLTLSLASGQLRAGRSES